MSLHFASLNSGSNGNCFYIGNASDAVLIDAGLSCKETEKRMKMLELKMDKIRAIFISHEHIDHIKGMEVLSKKHQIPVYLTASTLSNSRVPIPHQWYKSLAADCITTIGALNVHSFSKHHDAIEPVSFMIENNGFCVGVFTDIGVVCPKLIHHFSQCHAAFLETNYDEEMLETGSYPYHLKKRISGNEGHLSNAQALRLFIEHKPAHMTHLLPAHLSQENNDPKLVEALFAPHTGEIKITIAGRHKPTPVFSLAGVDTKKTAPEKSMQLDLF